MTHPDPAATKRARVIAARRKLRERFLAQIAQTPALSDPAPQGSGPPNRHGMPTLPVGQYVTDKWPVLDMGVHPPVTAASWSLRLWGAVAQPQTLGFDDLLALEQVDDVSDMHCVTMWSKLDMRWRGVRFSTVAALVEPAADATHLLIHASDGYALFCRGRERRGRVLDARSHAVSASRRYRTPKAPSPLRPSEYTTNLPLAEALKDDVLLVHAYEGAPLPHEHGGPVRMITPQLYAWKGAKWIAGVEFMTQNVQGFWEQRGYSDTAHPWRNDRYAGDGPPPETFPGPDI